MKVVSSVRDMQAAVESSRTAGRTIGLVPTMGALHDGHLSLVRRAKQECGVTVVSVFVNPAQFGPGEDYLNYPRDPERDTELLRSEGADFLFEPPVEEIYPPGFQSYITVEEVAEPLEGKFRPGHFRGVATVVAKLLNAVRPDRAYFGQKDAQQCVVIRRMVRDQHIPVEIVVCPTVREPDGLAMSSRNAYLDPEERKSATVLYRALCRARDLMERGERDAKTIEHEMRALIEAEPCARIDYAAVVDAETLQSVENVDRNSLAALAVWIGRARLIDNMRVGAQDAGFTFQL